MQTDWTVQNSTINSYRNDVYPAICCDVGRVYVVYRTVSNISGGSTSGGYDIAVFCLDSDTGKTLWTAQNLNINSNGDDSIPLICCKTDRVYITYWTNSTISGGTYLGGTNDIAVLCLDSNTGNSIWNTQNRTINSFGNDLVPAICCDTNRVYVVYGTNSTISGGTNTGNFDMAVFCLKSDTGVVIWTAQNLNINSDGNDFEPSICCTTGIVYIAYFIDTAGSTISGGSFSGGKDIAVFCLNSNSGETFWTSQNRNINSIGDDQFPAICCSIERVYITYYTFSNISGGSFSGGTDIAVFCLDSNTGDTIWTVQNNTINSDGFDLHPSICCGSDRVYITYHTTSTISGGSYSGGNYDIAVFVLDSNTGNTLWTVQNNTINSTANDVRPSICCDTNGSVYVSYATNSTISGGSHLNPLDRPLDPIEPNDINDPFNINLGEYDVAVFKLSPFVPPTPPPCFKKGSKILIFEDEKEIYRKVEELRVGDLVKTSKNGYLKIDLIGIGTIYNTGDTERIKDRLYRLSSLDYHELREDLILTGAHSVLVDTLSDKERDMTIENLDEIFITDEKYRLMVYLDNRSRPYEIGGRFDIYHLALENDNYYENYGIYAEGLLVETCSKRYLQELSKMKLIH